MSNNVSANTAGFLFPDSNSISGSQRMNGSRLAKECHSIHHIKFLIKLTSKTRPWLSKKPSPALPRIILNLGLVKNVLSSTEWLSRADLTPWAATMLGEGGGSGNISGHVVVVEEEEGGL